MTPLGKWLRKKAEQLLERYEEGPDPPERLGDMVVDFSNNNPRATRAEWAAFAAEHARECYRAGWVRGAEYVERVPGTWRPDVSPEEVADAHDPDWRWSEPVILRDPLAVVEDAVESEAAAMGRNLRRHGAA